MYSGVLVPVSVGRMPLGGASSQYGLLTGFLLPAPVNSTRPLPPGTVRGCDWCSQPDFLPNRGEAMRETTHQLCATSGQRGGGSRNPPPLNHPDWRTGCSLLVAASAVTPLPMGPRMRQHRCWQRRWSSQLSLRDSLDDVGFPAWAQWSSGKSGVKKDAVPASLADWGQFLSS